MTIIIFYTKMAIDCHNQNVFIYWILIQTFVFICYVINSQSVLPILRSPTVTHWKPFLMVGLHYPVKRISVASIPHHRGYYSIHPKIIIVVDLHITMVHGEAQIHHSRQSTNTNPTSIYRPTLLAVWPTGLFAQKPVQICVTLTWASVRLI